MSVGSATRASIALALLLGACERKPPAGTVGMPSAPSSTVRASPERQPAPAPSPALSDAGANDAAVAGGPRAADPARLAALDLEARDSASDALIVRQGGKVLLDRRYVASTSPIQSMSITKSVLALVVGCLVEQGKLRVDSAVAEHFPAWQASPKKSVTVAHLLTHSSGLDEGKSTAEIYRAKSFLDHALSAKLEAAPGSRYEYGNRASNLLAALIARAAGKPTQEVTRECLFQPLGIDRFTWSVDSRGQAHGLAGLHLLPEDMAKLGELVLGRGAYEGRRVLAETWVRKVTEEPAPIQPPHKPMAALWWRLPQWSERVLDQSILDRWSAAQVPPEVIARVKPLKDRPFGTSLDFVRALREAFADKSLKILAEEVHAKKLPDANYRFGSFVGTFAHGSLGQFLVVVPEQQLVAVRMRRPPKRWQDRKDVEMSFPDFPQRVVDLTSAGGGQSTQAAITPSK